MSQPRQRYLEHPSSPSRARANPLPPQGAAASASATANPDPAIKPVNGWVLTEIPEHFGLNYSRLLTAKIRAVADDAGDFLPGDTIAFAESHGTEVREGEGRSWVALKASKIVAILDAVARPDAPTDPTPAPAPEPEPEPAPAPAPPTAPAKVEPAKESKPTPPSETKEKTAK